jgi:hypothetical protein
MIFSRLMTICVAGAALCAAAEAKEVRVRKGDHGLVDVVKRECNSVLWTSEVKWQSRIMDPSDLAFLKVGDVIVIPDQCVTEKPPKEVRRATLRLFKREKGSREAKHAQEESQTLLAKAINERDAAERLLDELQKRNNKPAALPSQVKQATKPTDDPIQWRDIAIGSAFGATMAFAGLWFFSIRPSRESNGVLVDQKAWVQEELQTVQQELQALRAAQSANVASAVQEASSAIVVEYFDEAIEFKISARFVKCKFCSENRITADRQNIIRHLNEAHPHLRVVERPAAEIRRELGMAG